ncbi:hypothetical protein LTR78_010310 [Recurvomyces mirabilis]|uniref:Ribosomal RNA methyltransferase FtsJ domain-containing protein n=1 Tax=Recurvomyces mirabilis TaxID=574656 RepID=A0AAE0TME6_9PEZI|nr:hypothetical protein LTR78_010310 [Recurvomyces mirabilis]KAK5149876.1 hypothetical protein LTS14_010591 [Recurvomyces mirabilis]
MSHDTDKSTKSSIMSSATEMQACAVYSPNKAIQAFLLAASPIFRELQDLRTRGWESPVGDRFFAEQRQVADNASGRTAEVFYKMMKKIAREMDRDTGVFGLHWSFRNPRRILDMCMAPGGYLAVALERHPGASALAFSLPTSEGGHKVLLPESLGVQIRYLDITMLAVDMGVDHIPEDHPDKGKFELQKVLPPISSDLIFCDGQVLRTHQRAKYRERREAARLTSSQLALGLQHIEPGGTMVILLHKAEAWPTLNLIYQFSKFATLKLFKPVSFHAKRSSFYLIASDVRPDLTDARQAVETWKTLWNVATFGTEAAYTALSTPKEEEVHYLLNAFGHVFISLAQDIWATQARALARAPFMQA